MKQNIYQLFKSRVAQYGDRTLYRYKDSPDGDYCSLTWNEVYIDVTRVAKALLYQGFGAESMIGIFSNNKPEWSITDYAILAVRGVTVPFFGTATREQVKYIVDETGMKLIFVGNKEQFEKAYWLLEHTSSLKRIVYYGKDIQSEDIRCFSWDDFLLQGADDRMDYAFEKIQEGAAPDDLATLLYTSGTTGEPKGVMLSHDNFLSCFNIHQKRLDVTDNDVSMCFLPLSHVFERTWSYYMMFCGAENIFLENPREVIQELPVTNPTLMCVVPRFFEKTYEGIRKEYDHWPPVKQKIFDWSVRIGHEYSGYRSRKSRIPLGLALRRKVADRLVLKKLRHIFGKGMRTMPCSGAAISTELLKFFHATGLFVNYGYGATETTATVSCFRNDLYDFNTCGSIMPDVQVRITAMGEIQVKGPTVFKGYYKKTDQTAEVLNEGWYSTGDEGRLVSENMLVMSDRMRDLFKTSTGKFVSPQKIELLVGQNKYIEQVIAFGDNRKYITALIVPSFENLAREMKSRGISVSDPHQLVTHPEVLELFKNEILKVQESLASYERIVKFTLLPELFSIENNGLTSTLKVRRKVIREQYREKIERMYS